MSVDHMYVINKLLNRASSPVTRSKSLDYFVLVHQVLLYLLAHVEDRTVTIAGKRNTNNTLQQINAHGPCAFTHTHTCTQTVCTHTLKHTLYKGRLHASYPGSVDTGSRVEKTSPLELKNEPSPSERTLLHTSCSVCIMPHLWEGGRKEGKEEEHKEATTQDWLCSCVWCTQAGRHPFCTFTPHVSENAVAFSI